ncbi:MAG: B12-binding domain-containing radical SAM protein, partial [Thermoguttaceae bacterium]|nr:B12-binding domain-containing radical SAM protein [Thermoguttaceae bacterium]
MSVGSEPYYFDPELRRKVESILLPDVQLPGQYIGGELGRVVKRARDLRGRFCFAFPDAYAIGMSNYALQVLYSVVNAVPDLCCERAFAPFPDMEAKLRENRLALYSLETFSPLWSFDIVGFTLQHELSSTNILTMLDLGKIPIHREDRRAEDPLVMAGGPAAFNPEPFS